MKTKMTKSCKLLLAGFFPLVVLLVVGVVYIEGLESAFINERLEKARKAAELDPNVSEWIGQAAIGRVRFIGYGGYEADEGEKGLLSISTVTIGLEISRDDGVIVTNDYILGSISYFEDGTCSNFHSRAIKIVSELVPGVDRDYCESLSRFDDRVLRELIQRGQERECKP